MSSIRIHLGASNVVIKGERVKNGDINLRLFKTF